MKTNIIPILLLLCFGVAGVWFFQVGRKPYKHTKIPKRDRMDLAWAQEKEMTQDPKTKDVPKERLMAAYAYMQKLQQRQSKTGVTWMERGPSNNGGRTRSILVDLNDNTHRTVWAGSVSGGLWKTTDITADQPNWVPVNDFFNNMAITSITQAPANPQILYFATGEGNGNSNAVRGMGIWKSTDGGTNWTQLTTTNNSNFYYNQKVLTIGNGDVVLVCSQNGLFRSLNGGNSFTKVLGSGISSAKGNIAHDIERMSNGTLYASMSNGSSGGGTIHKSFNNGITWTTPSSVGVTTDEIELAVSSNDTNTIYGLVENSSTIIAIIKSSNAGAAFSATTGYPNDADGGISATDFSRGQAWYDMSICVNPLNANVVFVGGIDLFKTTNGGNTWQQVSHWYGGYGFQEVHADQHFAVYDEHDTSVVYFGNDGGVYRSEDAGEIVPTIISKEENYNTAQFYACDVHPEAGSNYFLAGAQDNGSHQFTSAGMNATTEVTGGDGAFCHIDQNEPEFQITSYVYNNYYVSNDGGESFNASSFGNTGRFINPTDYDDSLNILYAGNVAGKYLKWIDPQMGTSEANITLLALGGSSVTAITVSPSIVGRVYFGSDNGKIVYTDDAHNIFSETNGVSMGTPVNGYVSCITVDPHNEDHILVTYSNYGVVSIWETKNAGINWTNVEGNLPDMPVRWVIFHPTLNTQALIATELGVWQTGLIEGASTDWQPINNGLANVRCDMLKIRKSDNLISVATHGRGLYTTISFSGDPLPVASFNLNTSIGYTHHEVQFTNTSFGANSYRWDFGDGSSSTEQSPKMKYYTAGTYNVKLTVNNGASVANKTIVILPSLGLPYTLSDGGNFEVNPHHFCSKTISGTAFEKGNSTILGKDGVVSGGNAWVIGLSQPFHELSTNAYLYTPSYNFTAAGAYTFKFNAKHNLKVGHGGYRIEYSLNNGVTWLPLGTTVQPNWYDYDNTTTGRPFPQGEDFFSSIKSSYTLCSYATSALQGNRSVAFRFVFKSNAVLQGVGLAIDDLEITGPPNEPFHVGIKTVSTKNTKTKFVNAMIPLAGNSKQFYVMGNAGVALKCAVINQQGQVLKQVNLQSNDVIDCSDLSTGVYYFSFTNSEGQIQIEKIFVR